MMTFMISMNVFQKITRLLAIFILVSVLATSCKDDDSSSPSDTNLVSNESAEVPQAWMALFLELDQYALDFRPGPCARTLGYINLAVYEAVMDGMPQFKSLEGLYPGLDMPTIGNNNYHYPTVANAVYANLLKRFIPGTVLQPEQQSELQFKILELEQSFNDEFRSLVGGATFDRSQAHGEAVADEIWQWSATDAFGFRAFENARPSGYSPPTGPGLWQPTSPDFNAALFPYWGRVRCFAIDEEDKLAEEPIPFSEDPNSLFHIQALEVKSAVDNLDFTNQWIAEFWSDDFVGQTYGPVSRWISIAHQVLERENATMETAVYTYAKLSIALNDAGVAAWHSKYTFNVERPITYIQRNLQPDWTNHLDSNPSFPAYPSGHSTFGAAAAETLSHIFGYDYAMTDMSHDGRTEFLGMPRSFSTFYEMAEENAYSRIPLGVHFRMDAEEGVRLGFQVGRKVNDMPFK